MKKLLLLWMTALVVSVGLQAQRSYTFNVAAYNVDGLPETVNFLGINITTNAGAGGVSGATDMGEALQTENWEIVGLSEDFNYHEALVAPLTNYYHVATHGGEVGVESIVRSETDGLGLLVANKGNYPKFSGETRIAWSSYNGQTDNGADGMITKGFRYYAVTLDEGIIVDVYVLHMDAGSTADDIAVREEQLGELRDYILSHDNGRHTFVIGDWNCRYTRENMKTLFIDKINEVENMTIRDAWVECLWGGEYPKYGANAMMVTDATYGHQKGEVVDKILWIENSKSPLTIKCNMYERDETFPVTDHYPVLGNFTITNPTGEAINDWSVEGGDVSALIGVEGDMPQAGTVYYLKNVSTGLYLKPGGSWGSQLTEGNGGAPVTVENLTSDGTCILRTYASGRSIGSHDTPFWDNTDETSWTLEQVPGTQYQYYIKNAGGKAMASTGESGNPVTCSALTGADTQKWAFMSEAKMKEEMLNANETGFNITPLIQSAEFDAGNSADYGYYNNWENFSGTWNTWLSCGGSAGDYKTLAYIQSTASASTISQTLSNMPAGRYELSFDGLYRYEYYKKATSKPAAQDAGDLTVPITFGSQSTNLKKCTSVSVGDHAAAYNEFATTTTYNYTLSNTLTETTNLALSVAKPATTQQDWSKSTSLFGSMMGGSEGYNSWVVIDNFKLMFYPTSITEEAQREAELNELAAYINQAWDEVQAMGQEAVAAYDLSTLVYRYENGLISDDIEQEKAIVDEAVAVSKLAANQAVVDDALASDGDITSLIVNPSFETGDITGWTIGVCPLFQDENFDGSDAVTGKHGTYRLNVWSGDASITKSTTQTITNIPNGLYRLIALVATDDAAKKVYLIGNDYHAANATTVDAATFVEEDLLFLVKDRTATIGVIGNWNSTGYYHPKGGCWYKADNFRLEYVCDVAHGRVKLAIDDANAQAANFDEYGKAVFNISQYETAYANKTITGDGSTEVNAIYANLMAAAKAQKTVNAPMTAAITNPNFEEGTMNGWNNESKEWDTRAASQDNLTYAAAGADGRFLFNTWYPGDIAGRTYQVVSGIPNGKYSLNAMIATAADKSVNITANGTTSTITGAAAMTYYESKEIMVPATISEFEVTDGTATIQVMGVDSAWYKFDNVQMTYLGRELTLNETDTSISYEDGWYTSVALNRNVKANTWNTFVVPFNMEIPSGWTVKELSSATQVGDVISMTFSDASSIEAGTPYMVKTSSAWSGTTIENTDVTSVLNDVEGSGIVTFKGNYISGNVPTDAFFISGNKFYQAINENNTLKAFRGYFEATGAAGVNVLNFTFDDEVTGIDTTVAEPTAEVIAIYSLDGRRIESLQRGVNIVKLSNGKTKKLIVK